MAGNMNRCAPLKTQSLISAAEISDLKTAGLDRSSEHVPPDLQLRTTLYELMTETQTDCCKNTGPLRAMTIFLSCVSFMHNWY